MASQKKVGRREFLRLSAMAAGGAVVVACGGDGGGGQATQPAGTAVAGESTQSAPGATATTPTDIGGKQGTPAARPASFKEAPMIKQMGNLPPVEERLPKNPYVVPHKWVTPGKYGGHMRMGCSDTWGTAHFVQESMYGHSILRWLDDGLAIGPGLAESWKPNADQSEWTLKFREGLKWSDGKPWTTADIMFWWEDMVNYEPYGRATPPDEARSGKGTLMKMTAPDETTIVMKFDAPAPLTADRLAMWVNRGIGPDWMQPKHYLQQFHKKYNPKVPKNWADTFDSKKDFATNRDCPTMTGWRLKAYKEAQFSQWERNPFYWCVDKQGNQLPFIDRVTMTNSQDKEVMKLQFQEGKVDYVHGAHTPLDLSDVAGLKQSQPRSGLELFFWDSGSGTGSIFFFNYDYPDKKMRDLIRKPEFRKALSHAVQRDEIRKVVYYNTGEATTGTLSPKAIEYNVNDEGKQVYQQWRDSAIKYDKQQAMQLLDQLEIKDTNNDGVREMPDGSKLQVLLDFPADTGPEHLSKNNLLVKDWKAIGIDAKLNPVPPTGFNDRWKAGKLMSKTAWEVGDGPNHLVYPQWLVPIEWERWAPLEGSFYEVRGTPKEKQELNVDPYKRTPPRMAPEKGGPIDRLWKIYDQSKVEPDPMKRHRMVWDMIKIHVDDGPFFMGTVANTPRIVLVRDGLKNVPRREDLALGGFVNPWIHPTPAVYDPEAYYWDNPEEHA